MDRQVQSGRLEGACMIEVLFGESEAGAMEAAKHQGSRKGKQLEGTADEVICLALMLDMGDLSEDVCSAYRKEFIYAMYDQGQWGKDPEAAQELKEAGAVYCRERKRLIQYLEAGEEIRIWYSKSAYAMCGLYDVCHLLLEYPNRVFLVALPEDREEGNRIVSYQNWGEIAAEEFAWFVEKQKEISKLALQQYAAQWSALVKDNSPLRAVVNNCVIGVEETFYDFILWKKLTEKPVKQARLIGEMLGSYPISIGDWWYAKRIQCYIDQGKIEIVEDSENKYARIIRKIEREIS